MKAQPVTEPPLIVLLGPTAVGKTTLSLALCDRFQGEIIGADSRQVYRLLDIGSAKPTPDERARAPHHLVDVRMPDQVLTLAEYQRMAYAAIDEIHRRGRIPFLTGGSALYLRSVVDGLRIPEVAPDPAVRAELEAFLEREGAAALFRRLQAVDPKSAALIDGRNHRRVLRALEIFTITGVPKVDLEGQEPPPYRILKIGLQRTRAELYGRIDQRVDAMLAAGLVDETRYLLQRYPPELPALTSLGYREIGDYLCGKLTLDAAVARIKTETHRYVRHQLTWFRKMKEIRWFEMEPDPFSAIETEIAAFLSPK